MAPSTLHLIRPSWALRILALLVLAGMASGGANATPQKAAGFYDEALKLYGNKDYASTAIQLKNALQQDPKMLAAHVLLGKVLLQSGELKGAEASLEEALRLGVDRSEVVVPLGRVYLQLDEGGKLLDRIRANDLPPTLRAEVLTLRGTAHAMAGNATSAVESFAQARLADPRSPGPLLAEVPFILRSGDIARAKLTAQNATQMAPDDAGAWYVLGTVLQATQEASAALAAYDKALRLNDKHVDSHIGRAAVLMLLKRDGEAEQVLLRLKSAAVEEPRASFMRGNLAAKRGDPNQAKAEFNDAVSLIDSMSPGIRSASEPLLLAGALSHRALGNLAKAREYLETLLYRNSRHVAGSMTLASVLLDLREFSKATPLLDSLQRALPNDPQVLYMSGTALMGKGQYVQAAELFERAAARGGSTEALRELGISQLSAGQSKQGLASLEQAFAKNPTDTRAGLQLAMTYLRAGHNAKALKTAEQLSGRDPDSLDLLNFLGTVKARTGDKRGARLAWDRALSKDPSSRVSALNLTWLDMEEGKLDSARWRAQQLLSKQPDDPEALLQLGSLEARAQRLQQAIDIWRKADAVQSADPRAALAVVDLLLNQRVFDQALLAAKHASAKFPNLLVTQSALARAQLSSGDVSGARQTLTAATSAAAFQPEQLVILGRLHLAAGNPEGAVHSTTKALQASPDDLGALVLRVETEASRKNSVGVDRALASLRSKHPSAVATLLTSGHVAMSRGQFASAQALYGQAMDREPSSGNAIALAQSYAATREFPKAIGSLQEWSKKSPRDTAPLKALADVQMAAGNEAGARDSLKQVSNLDPTDVATLLGLATLHQKAGDPAALAVAERAVGLAPTNAAATSLLGSILVQQGQLEAGIRHLRDARLRDPSSGLVRYRLAQALAASGRLEEAKSEMSAALGATDKPTSAEAQKLRARLGL